MPENKTYLANLENQETIINKLDTNVIPDLGILVQRVTPAEGGGLFYIQIACSSDYNDATFTAQHATGTSFTGKASGGQCRIEVTKAGVYTITNNVDSDKITVTVNDVTNARFFSFRATVKVTVPEALIGSTITCTQEEENFKETAASTTVLFTVNKAGTWNIGVEGNTYITASTNVENEGYEYPVTLSVTSGVPVIHVTASGKLNGLVLKCTKDAKVLSQTVKERSATFVLAETGTWQLSCDTYPEKTVDVLVESAKTVEARYTVSEIYGVRVKQNESDPARRVEYVEDAVGMTPVQVDQSSGTVNYNGWDEKWIFDKIYPVMLTADGSESYKLNPNDYTRRADGSTSDVANTSYNGNAMVHIDKFYFKAYEEGGYEYLLVSDEPEDGFEPVGFKRADGSEMDCNYLPMFKGWIDGSGRLRSISGQSLRCNTSYTDFRSAAQKMGTNYWLEPHSLITLFDTLYLILFKNDNSQAALGQGRDYNNGSGSVSGTNMTIRTGIMNNKGPIAYDPLSKGVKFMHVEDYWGNNLYFWMDGFMYDGPNVYIKWNAPYNSASKSGYTQVPTSCSNLSGYISKSIADTRYGRIPCETKGSDSTYQCDNFYSSGSSGNIYACYRAVYGVWFRNYSTVSYATANFGAALSFEPPKGA